MVRASVELRASIIIILAVLFYQLAEPVDRVLSAGGLSLCRACAIIFRLSSLPSL